MTLLIPALLATAGRYEDARGALGACTEPSWLQLAGKGDLRLVCELHAGLITKASFRRPRHLRAGQPSGHRQGHDSTGWVPAFMAEQRPVVQARQQATQAARAVSQGKSREEIRQLLRAKLDERDVKMQPVAFEQTVDLLATEREPLGKARLVLRGLKALKDLGGQGRPRAVETSGGQQPEPEEQPDPAWAKTPVSHLPNLACDGGQARRRPGRWCFRAVGRADVRQLRQIRQPQSRGLAQQRRAHVPRPARADRACGLQAHRFPRPSGRCRPSRRHRCSRRKVRGCNDGGTRDADGRDSALRPRSSSAVADARATTRIVGRKIRPPRTANRERTGRSRPDALRWSSQLARRSEHANQTTDDDASRRQPRHRTQEVAAEDRLATSKLYSLRGALAHER